MTTTTRKPKSLPKLCWAIVGRWEQMPREEQESFERTYQETMTVARLTTGNLVAPKPECRARLEDLHDALGRELDRQRERAKVRERVAKLLGPDSWACQSFRDWLAATAAQHGKPVEQVAAWWLEYSDACAGEGGQSALMSEFERWYADKLAA